MTLAASSHRPATGASCITLSKTAHTWSGAAPTLGRLVASPATTSRFRSFRQWRDGLLEPSFAAHRGSACARLIARTANRERYSCHRVLIPGTRPTIVAPCKGRTQTSSMSGKKRSKEGRLPGSFAFPRHSLSRSPISRRLRHLFCICDQHRAGWTWILLGTTAGALRAVAGHWRVR